MSLTEFNLTEFVQDVCRDISERLPQFAHVDVCRIAFSFLGSRNESRCGVWASITPLRFANGAMEEIRRGRRVRMNQLKSSDGVDYLYIFRVSFPRMWNLSFEEKISTITHELLHISPEFNGDIRRFSGRCYAHGNAKLFNANAQALAERWLSLGPPEELLVPFRWTSQELMSRYDRVTGLRVGRPRIIPVS